MRVYRKRESMEEEEVGRGDRGEEMGRGESMEEEEVGRGDRKRERVWKKRKWGEEIGEMRDYRR